jgi:hypothetical protein
MGVTYEADLGPNALNVTGSVKAEAGEGGRGVKFTVNFADIPKEGGPFGKFSLDLLTSVLANMQSVPHPRLPN